LKAILITEPPSFELTSISDPECGPGQVIVRTAFCGICGTDLEMLRGTMPAGFARYPVVPGHEWTGVVEEIGADVTSLRIGDRVSVEGYLPCGQCARCRAGSKNLCVRHEQIGMTHNGGLASLVAAPAVSCHRVESHVGLDEALMVEPASTVVRGIDRINPRPGCLAAVIGCGPIGLIAARVLAMLQAREILGVDLAPTQEPVASRAGFTQFTVSQDPKELRERSGSDGWDVVVVCAHGTKPLSLAFDIVRRGGGMVIIGGGPASNKLELAANQFVLSDIHIEGILGYTTQSWTRTLDLVSSGSLQLADLITHRRPLAEFKAALELVESRAEPIGKVAISFQDLA
jgi:2-desacetyl-2-hydroxyethyl bacteriochlorophyllide A dehydrogenase